MEAKFGLLSLWQGGSGPNEPTAFLNMTRSYKHPGDTHGYDVTGGKDVTDRIAAAVDESGPAPDLFR